MVDGDGPLLVDLLRESLDNSPASTSYLDHLISLSLDDLLHEPSLIASESSTVEAELTNLCYREYTTFTLAHKSSAAVHSAFDDFGASLHALVEAAPPLEEACRAFTKTTASAQTARARVTLVHEHQNKLAELLELPQLMETCVRNGFYQEAMDLAEHTRRLGDNPLVQDVVMEVEGVLEMMTTQLLALLREPIKLPALIKAVGFLRRLGHEDLGLVFLQSRLYNYRSKLPRTPDLRRYIDLFREHVYDIISQYSAIFEISSHLVAFASQCVEELVHTIATSIPLIHDAASLSSILVQLGYCALSFARVGLDFALLTNEYFFAVVEATYAQAVSAATTDFAARLKTTSHFPRSEDSISHYPPLAIFLNAHVDALNGLRLLAPLESRRNIVVVQHASLAAGSSALLQYFDETLVSEAPSAPSSPRSQLLRRNTETQLAPEVRAAKRRETKRGCITMAQMWRDQVIPTLVQGLQGGVYEAGEAYTGGVEDWLAQYEPNGEPRTPPRSPVLAPVTP